MIGLAASEAFVWIVSLVVAPVAAAVLAVASLAPIPYAVAPAPAAPMAAPPAVSIASGARMNSTLGSWAITPKAVARAYTAPGASEEWATFQNTAPIRATQMTRTPDGHAWYGFGFHTYSAGLLWMPDTDIAAVRIS